MIRSSFTDLINDCVEHKFIVAEKQARYALALWSYARDDEARKQLSEARKLYYKNLET
jgi:hypothetical protein